LRGKKETEGTVDVSYLDVYNVHEWDAYLMSAVDVGCPKSKVWDALVPEVADSLLASIDKEGAPESDLGGVGAAH
jgi:hypothetical protein